VSHRSVPRAEVVGSLLRPPALVAAMTEVYSKGHTALLDEERAKNLERLHRLEDELIADAVPRQIEIGLDVVTDGEFRRAAYSNSFYDAVEGLEPNPQPMRFYSGDGSYVEYGAPPVAARRLRKVASPAAAEASYLATLTGHLFKVALPAPSRWCLPYTHQSGTDNPYGSLDELAIHAVEIEKELVQDVVDAGCRYVQFDFPAYPMFVDERWTGPLREQGADLEGLLDLALRLDAEVVSAVPAGIRKGLHVCRGNHRSRWLFQGSLEPVAERLFALPYDSFLVEWEDVDREGGYEPIRFLPAGKVAAMGLVSSKTARLESVDEVMRRLDEASQLVDADRLALSTQCGFASTWHGNEIDAGTMWRKLELVAKVADRVWP
jgi:5-methyltetrahydropteroyltriglutamate--homocysteine methyltransferase